MADPREYTAPEPPPGSEFRSAVEPGRVLCFAPHPDDEVMGTGGVLWMHRQQGDPVRVIVATSGTAGDPDGRHPKDDYIALRKTESRTGLRKLGVDDVRFWGFPDSCQLSESDMELGAQKAAAEITEHRPDAIYLPWEREGHPDHHAFHLCVMRAMDRTGYRGRAYGYEVWNAMVPDLIVDITAAVEHKRAALLAHQSQRDYVRYEHCILGLNAYRSLVHSRGQGYAEAFRILRR